MIVIIEEITDSVYKRDMKTFKRKGLRYYLFIFSLKIFGVKYEVMKDDRRLHKRIRKKSKNK